MNSKTYCMQTLFAQLNLDTRARLVWEDGKLISDRSDAHHRITLYKLFSFYVEVYCDLDFTTIEEIRPVARPDIEENAPCPA
jgi:hypothetical protein